MENKDSSVVTELVASLNQLSGTIETLLDYGTTTIKESTEDFVNGKMGKMFGMASAYRTCLQRLGLGSKQALEDLIEASSGRREVREAGEQLLDIEQDWDNFLIKVDKSLDEETCDTVRDELSSQNGSAVVVSFGERAGAVRWLEEMRIPFPMLLDADKKVYHKFGLKRSVYKVWRVASLVYYGEELAAGRSLPKPYEGVHDDPHQMGGDFILDSAGIVRFLYPSATAIDRPAISLLLRELQKLAGAQLECAQ